MLYAETENALKELIDRVYCHQEHGTEPVFEGGDTHTYDPKKDLKEHFGFRDGISQPILWGLSKAKKNSIDDLQKIKPGEIVLGLDNEYGSKAPSPHDPEMDLGENGSYLVFRQIEQHVEKFWKFLHENSVEDGVSEHERAIKLGAKMIGRWPDGESLVTCPEGNCPTDEKDINNFTYDSPDKYGSKCPLGAHVRRTNPRDQVHTGRGADDSLIMSRRHRMLRRGRIYGVPLDQEFNIDNIICQVKNSIADTPENNTIDSTPPSIAPKPGQTPIIRGLHFICLVSDIGRQFEFVQNVWANTPTFADLRNESDPIIAPKSAIGDLKCAEFTAPNTAIRTRYSDVPEFTTVVGGSYFFMPGLTALKQLLKYEPSPGSIPTF
jgi:Dyp-type peroxidase family